MFKWIFILNLLGENHETSEIEWHEMIREENLSFEICIEKVVETVNLFEGISIRYEVYCEEIIIEENKDK